MSWDANVQEDPRATSWDSDAAYFPRFLSHFWQQKASVGKVAITSSHSHSLELTSRYTTWCLDSRYHSQVFYIYEGDGCLYNTSIVVDALKLLICLSSRAYIKNTDTGFPYFWRSETHWCLPRCSFPVKRGLGCLTSNGTEDILWSWWVFSQCRQDQ